MVLAVCGSCIVMIPFHYYVFLHACMHYDLFSVVLLQSAVFEACVTLVLRN